MWSHRQNYFCTAAADGAVAMWQLGAQQSMWEIRIGREAARCCALHPTQPHVAVGSAEGRLRVFDTSTRTLLQEMSQHHTPIVAVCYQPSGQRLLSLGGFWPVRP